MGFPKSTSDVALQWTMEVFNGLRWFPNRNVPCEPGEAGGFFVSAQNFPFSAYLKPTKLDGRPRAAYEKIVSDLAYKIGVLVPPVLLYKRRDAPRGEEINTCVSLVSFPVIVPWRVLEEIKAFDHLDEVKEALGRYVGIVALDTYVGNDEDRTNLKNIVYGSESEKETDLISLDFSNALNYEGKWNDNRSGAACFPKMPERIVDAAKLNRRIVDATVTNIENLEECFINHIVNRIPDEFLDSAEKQVILNGLMVRRALVRRILADHLA